MSFDIQKVVKLACQGKYEELDQYIGNDIDMGNIIVRIAIKSKDKQLFEIANHYTRRIMEEFADNNDLFPFLLEQYGTEYFKTTDVPSYVWESCTPENKKLLQEISGQKPYVEEEPEEDE
jgi:hypothetical protein